MWSRSSWTPAANSSPNTIPSPGAGQEVITFVADSAGNYELKIQPRYSKAPKGRYEIRVAEVLPADERDRRAFEAHQLTTAAAKPEAAGKCDEAMRFAERALSLRESARPLDEAYVGK